MGEGAGCLFVPAQQRLSPGTASSLAQVRKLVEVKSTVIVLYGIYKELY